MNNCMLLAEIIQAPQLRYTSDTQTPVAEFVVQFPALRDGDPAGQMKVVGWGNLAQEIQDHYQVGQRVLLEGRLGMNTVERPEGYKEKQAELTVQRIYNAGTFATMPMTAPALLGTNTTTNTAPRAAAPQPAAATPRPTTPPPSPVTDADPGINYDEIPF
jgi:single-strand DNA-binding protein